MIILRQQYLSKPNSSKILPGSSPAADLRSNSSYLSPTTLPQLKHLTGIMFLFYSLFFLEWFSLIEKPVNLFYSLSIVFITFKIKNKKRDYYLFYGFTRVIVLGNAMASLIVSNPHNHITTRATPIPKPE